MTVASQMKQTLASLKGATATVQKYASHHPDPVVKADFARAELQLQNMIRDLEVRVGQIEFAEPQFKGF